MSFADTQRAALATLVLCAVSIAAYGDSGDDLVGMSLAQLMNEPITSVSKKPSRLSDSAAAVAVVTQEDIRRLGIASLPEALRLVPGLDVAQISSNAWAISARGFNDQFAGKLLVLIDGRSVYTPATAGVFWNAQDLMIEDVERIEVIRGPGATLWGANAVNGVINIITKRAQDTLGSLVSGMGGTEPNSQFAARYGAAVNEDLQYRVYAKYLDQSGLFDSTHTFDTGAWHTARTGFRVDYAASAVDALTVQGDIYSGDAGTLSPRVTLFPPSSTEIVSVQANNGANVLGRWTHDYSPDSALTLQTYFDHIDQGDGSSIEHRYTYDLDLQHRFSWRANDLLWGAGFRKITVDEVSNGLELIWTPSQRNFQIMNVFLQDDVTVLAERLHAIVGVKFEHDSLVQSTVDPNVRLLWTPSNTQTVWGAVSQASRTPALFELDARANLAISTAGPGEPPVLVSLIPNSRLRSERLTAFELGYRISPHPGVSLDIASFANHYSDGITGVGTMPVIETTYGPPDLLIPIANENSAVGWTYGIETAAHLQPLSNWQLAGGYTFLRMNVSVDSGLNRESPQHQVQLRSYLDLPMHLQFNGALYYVSSVDAPADADLASIPAYVRADLGLVWNPSRTFSIGIWGQNLLERRHLEYASQISTVLTEIPRSLVGKVSWSF